MARYLQTTSSYFHDRTVGYEISKAELERRALGLDRTGDHPHRPTITDKAELRALAHYGRAVRQLFSAWKAVSTAFHQEIEDRDGDAALQGCLAQLDVLVQQVEALAVPDRAAAVQRLFIAMLRSERAYFQNIFDDVDDAVIQQYAADFQQEAAMFLAEFERLLRASGQNLQGPR